MKFFAAATLILLTAFVHAPSEVQAQEACEFYRVKKGDSLVEIAKAAYGDDDYRRIWRSNRSEVGRNPNILRVGRVLRLPCLDGTLPEATGGVTITATDGEAVSFVTANGYLPYTDESLSRQGIITELVRTAMFRASPKKNVEIVFVNDWAAHMETLLPRQAFDASFPWTRPGCETQSELTQTERYACENFLYSDPLYEIVDGFFAKSGSGFEAVISWDGLNGARICRPEGYSTSHLEEVGLMPPAISLITPDTTHACFELLMKGQVDLVALDTRSGERVKRDLGLTFDVIENPHLFSIQPLQVAFHKDNPNSETLISEINRGIANMLQSGEWASIVTEGLQTQALVN